MSAVVAPNDYVAIPVATLAPSSVLGVSLFMRTTSDRAPRLYRGPNYPLCKDDLCALESRGISRLYVLAADYGQYQDYLRQQLATLAADRSTPVDRRLSMLNEVARTAMGDAFKRRDVDAMVDQAEEIGRHTVELLCQEGVLAGELIRVLHHDYQTFTHSANVSYYCVLLARGLGISATDELDQIASGALLHDVGKLQIPPAILTKPSRLTEQEFDVIKRHPTDGFKLLCHRKDLSFAQLMMAYQHHERIDGSGYPVGVTEREIHPWARICAVVDVFEALTSNRSYRGSLSLDEALVVMNRNAGLRFDRRVYECWKAIINSR